LESNLLRDQEATALKFGDDKTATSARSSLILTPRKASPTEIQVEVRPCGFGLSASEFLSNKGLQCSKGVPCLQQQRESCSKGASPRNAYLAESAV
jgi:hypothetical protein